MNVEPSKHKRSSEARKRRNKKKKDSSKNKRRRENEKEAENKIGLEEKVMKLEKENFILKKNIPRTSKSASKIQTGPLNYSVSIFNLHKKQILQYCSEF